MTEKNRAITLAKETNTTAFKVSFKVGRRISTWLRFGESLEVARATAEQGLEESYFGKAKLIEVVELV